MDNFITYDYLQSFAGLVFCTYMVVNFLKDLKFIKSIPTRYFTALVALILNFTTTFVVGNFDVNNIPLMIINGILISCSSNGVYDFGKDMKDRFTKDSNEVVEEVKTEINNK